MKTCDRKPFIFIAICNQFPYDSGQFAAADETLKDTEFVLSWQEQCVKIWLFMSGICPAYVRRIVSVHANILDLSSGNE